MEKSFRGHLLECDVPEDMVDEIGKTYKKAHLFRSSLKNETLVDVFVKKLLKEAEGWEIDPVAGAIRTAWSTLQPAAAAVASAPMGSSELLPATRFASVSGIERVELETEFLSSHTDEVLDAESKPGLLLLSAVKRMQKRDVGLSHIPWHKSQSLAFESANAAQTQKDLQSFQRMGLLPEDKSKASLDMVKDSAGSFALMQLLLVRAVAYVMYGFGSLGVWKLYVKRFISLYGKSPASGCRGPSLEEAQEADAEILRGVFNEVNKKCYLESGKLAEISETLDVQLKAVCGKGSELDCLLRQRVAVGEKRPLGCLGKGC